MPRCHYCSNTGVRCPYPGRHDVIGRDNRPRCLCDFHYRQFCMQWDFQRQKVAEERMRRQQIAERQKREQQRMQQERMRRQQIAEHQKREQQRMQQERMRRQQIAERQKREQATQPQKKIQSNSNANAVVHKRGLKRALLVGCTYRGGNAPLSGPLNGVNMIRSLLESKFNFHKDEIKILVEGAKEFHDQPRRNNIINGLEWLTSHQGGNIFFYFSGHGARSSACQYICPMDHIDSGMISSSNLHEKLVMRVGKNTTLYALIDACYSGNVFSLPLIANISGGAFKKWNACFKSSVIHNHSSPGCVYQFSAATETEVAYEVQCGNRQKQGAATYAFCTAIEKRSNVWNGNATLVELIEYMHYELKHSGKYPNQTPTLSSDSLNDCSRTTFSL